jgi:hypothetical protein
MSLFLLGIALVCFDAAITVSIIPLGLAIVKPPPLRSACTRGATIIPLPTFHGPRPIVSSRPQSPHLSEHPSDTGLPMHLFEHPSVKNSPRWPLWRPAHILNLSPLCIRISPFRL